MALVSTLTLVAAKRVYDAQIRIWSVVPNSKEQMDSAFRNAQQTVDNITAESTALTKRNVLVYPPKPTVLEGVLYTASTAVAGVVDIAANALSSLGKGLGSAVTGVFSGIFPIIAAVVGAGFLLRSNDNKKDKQ